MAGVEKKRQILEAASRVFRDRGLHATSMRDIAAEAGMQVGNLYYYFENKGALLAFCQLDTLNGLLGLAQWVQEQPLSPSGRLFLLVKGHVLFLNETTPGSLAHLEVEALEEPWRQEIVARRDEYEDALCRIIEAGVKEGLFRPVDVKVSALAILGAVNWTVKWFQPAQESRAGGKGEKKNAEQIGERFAEQMVRGLLADFVPPRTGLPPLETLTKIGDDDAG